MMLSCLLSPLYCSKNKRLSRSTYEKNSEKYTSLSGSPATVLSIFHFFTFQQTLELFELLRTLDSALSLQRLLSFDVSSASEQVAVACWGDSRDFQSCIRSLDLHESFHQFSPICTHDEFEVNLTTVLGSTLGSPFFLEKWLGLALGEMRHMRKRGSLHTD